MYDRLAEQRRQIYERSRLLRCTSSVSGDGLGSDEDILEELRRRPGWWHYRHADLDDLALRAYRAGCLRFAFVVAQAKWDASASSSSSSQSSVVFVAFGPDGRAEDSEAFLLIVHRELVAALADVGC